MNEVINLVSPTFKITKITKKTTAKLFADICEGDSIRISSEFRYRGRASRGAYASYVTVENITQGTSAVFYVSSAAERLDCFEIEIVGEVAN